MWGDRRANETIVIATPGYNGKWDWHWEGTFTEEEAVRQHSLALASSMLDALSAHAVLEDGRVLAIPDGFTAYAMPKQGDDLMLFVDVYIVLDCMRKGGLYGDKICVSRLQELNSAANAHIPGGEKHGSHWSLLTAITLPTRED